MFWRLHKAQTHAESRVKIREGGMAVNRYTAALVLLGNHLESPSNEVLEHHYFKICEQLPGESITHFISALQAMAAWFFY